MFPMMDKRLYQPGERLQDFGFTSVDPSGPLECPIPGCGRVINPSAGSGGPGGKRRLPRAKTPSVSDSGTHSSADSVSALRNTSILMSKHLNTCHYKVRWQCPVCMESGKRKLFLLEDSLHKHILGSHAVDMSVFRGTSEAALSRRDPGSTSGDRAKVLESLLRRRVLGIRSRDEKSHHLRRAERNCLRRRVSQLRIPLQEFMKKKKKKSTLIQCGSQSS